MILTSNQAEAQSILATAQAMAMAARTAPKTRGQDFLQTLILTGEDIDRLADTMERLGTERSTAFLLRDAGNVRSSSAVLLLGIGKHTRNLNEICGYCGSPNCAESSQAGNTCVFDPIDLGIAVGSAVSVAADARMDNRVMFSAGVAAKALGLFGTDITSVLGIPLSASGKSIYFDRKPK